MSLLKGKVILVISPQEWGTMFVAKHHYAVELAKQGNEVYFLNPPDNNRWLLRSGKTRINIKPVAEYPGLHLINHLLYFPFLLRFHGRGIFDLLMRKQVKDILKAIGKKVDIVWSFDLNNIYPLGNFPGAYKIFHPVDEPLNKEAIDAGKGADIIFSVTREILEKYERYNVPKYFVHHGVADYFFDNSKVIEQRGAVHVGLSGNWLRPDIDREILLAIVRDNPQVVFEFWGSYKPKEKNLGGNSDKETLGFIEKLQTYKNARLHGAVKSSVLSGELKRMQAFLICYDVNKDQSKGTNYHKIMEYLAAGKIIVSNNVTTFHNRPDLIQMVQERDNNKHLPGLFKSVIADLQKFNSPELQQTRIYFAQGNRYLNQLGLIEKYILENSRHS